MVFCDWSPRSAFKVYPCRGMNQYFLLLRPSNIPFCSSISHLTPVFSGGVLKKAGMHIYVQGLFFVYISFQFFGYKLRSTIAGLCEHSLCNFLS